MHVWMSELITDRICSIQYNSMFTQCSGVQFMIYWWPHCTVTGQHKINCSCTSPSLDWTSLPFFLFGNMYLTAGSRWQSFPILPQFSLKPGFAFSVLLQEQDIYLATRNPIKSFLFILFAFERCSGPLGYLFIELLKLFWIETFGETELFLETYFRYKYIMQNWDLFCHHRDCKKPNLCLEISIWSGAD